MMILDTADIPTLKDVTAANLREDAKGVSTLEIDWCSFLPDWARYMEPVTLVHNGRVLFHGKVTECSNSNEGNEISSRATISNVLWLLDHQTLAQQLAELVAAEGGDATASLRNARGLSFGQLADGVSVSMEGWIPQTWTTDSGTEPTEGTEGTEANAPTPSPVPLDVECYTLGASTTEKVATQLILGTAWLQERPLRELRVNVCGAVYLLRPVFAIVEQEKSGGGWEPVGISYDRDCQANHYRVRPVRISDMNLAWHFRGVNIDPARRVRFRFAEEPRFDAPAIPLHIAAMCPDGDDSYIVEQGRRAFGNVRKAKIGLTFSPYAYETPATPMVATAQGTVTVTASRALRGRYLLMSTGKGVCTTMTAISSAMESNPDAFLLVDYETANVQMLTINETESLHWAMADAERAHGDVRFTACSGITPQYEAQVTGVCLALIGQRETGSGSGNSTSTTEDYIAAVYTWPDDLDLTQTGVKVFSVNLGSGFNPVDDWKKAAEEYYNAANVLQWGGSVSCYMSDLAASPLGCKLNITGNRAPEEWGSMEAVISACSWDFMEGIVEMELGRDFADPTFAEPTEADEPDEPDDDTTDDDTTDDFDDLDSSDDDNTTDEFDETFPDTTEPSFDDAWPTEPTETEPTETEPTETEPTETEPTETEPTETEPTETEPTETEPTETEGTEGHPTHNTDTEPTESEGGNPPAPTGTGTGGDTPPAPTDKEPTETEPTETEPTGGAPTGQEPTEPTGQEPTAPTGQEPTEPTEQEPTDAPPAPTYGTCDCAERWRELEEWKREIERRIEELENRTDGTCGCDCVAQVKQAIAEALDGVETSVSGSFSTPVQSTDFGTVKLAISFLY